MSTPKPSQTLEVPLGVAWDMVSAIRVGGAVKIVPVHVLSAAGQRTFWLELSRLARLEVDKFKPKPIKKGGYHGTRSETETAIDAEDAADQRQEQEVEAD